MRKSFIYRSLFVPVVALALLPVGCGHNHDEHGDEHDHEAAEAKHEEGHGDDVVMNHEAVEKAGLEYETVELGEFREVVKASGVLENARGAERVIVAPASGVVSFRSGVVAGAAVSAGEGLFTISSQGLEQGDATATVHVDKTLAEKELRRAEELVKDNLISKKEYERIRAEYERAKANESSVAARSRSGVGVSSPIGGFLAEVSVRPGSFVNMGDPLAIVAANRRLMLRANVSERDRAFVGNITGANVAIGRGEALSLEGRNLRVLSGNGAQTGASHYIPVYLEFDNPGSLGSGSVGEVWLLGAPQSGVISVPKSAVIEENGYYYVYIEEESEKEHTVFERKEVKLGGFDGRRYAVVSGLEPGEKVVTEGALKVKMAGMGAAIPGHSHHH